MGMRRPLPYLFGLFIFVSLACNAFAGEPAPGLLRPTLAVTAVVATPPPGLAPTLTLPATAVVPTLDPAAPQVRALVNINIRTGPGVQYTGVGFLRPNERALALGRHPASGWWQIQCPPSVAGSQCWVSGGAQYTAGSNVGGLPAAVASPPPNPPSAAPN